MKKQIFTMLTGLLIGAALTGGSIAVAADARCRFGLRRSNTH